MKEGVVYKQTISRSGELPYSSTRSMPPALARLT